MAIYEFKCKESRCLRITTASLPIGNEQQNIKCDHCGGKAKRIMSLPSGYNMKGYSAKNSYSGEKKNAENV